MMRSMAKHALIIVAVLAAPASGHTWFEDVAAGLFDVPIGTCCHNYGEADLVPAIYCDDPGGSGDWMPVVDVDGRAFEAGHRHDAYYCGDKRGKPPLSPPEEYAYEVGDGATSPIVIDLARAYTEVTAVSFPSFQSFEDGQLTDVGKSQVHRWVHAIYGPDATVKRLGEGGFSVVFKVCRGGLSCVVVKVRKIPPAYTPGQRLQQLRAAVEELRRDMAIAEFASAIVGRGRINELDGHRHRLARVARITDRALLAKGVIEQELVAFEASEELEAALEALGKGKAARARALQQADKAGKRSDAEDFLEAHYKPSKFGPEVIKVHAWWRRCQRLADVADLERVCSLARRDFRVPDNFDRQLGALQQLYRDSAGEVIRFTRRNFTAASGNAIEDGSTREVGLDYNHGRNVGWEPRSRQFVLFDY